jgi:hypothetical protein
MKTVQYEKSDFPEANGEPAYTLYFFYIRKKYDGEWCWLWDDNKLTIDDALKLYPPSKYYWQEITEDL